MIKIGVGSSTHDPSYYYIFGESSSKVSIGGFMLTNTWYNVIFTHAHYTGWQKEPRPPAFYRQNIEPTRWSTGLNTYVDILNPTVREDRPVVR